ncbi:DUF3667 domain-containing protein [Larkinella humicola]|uniref:DUF3667 domain-containing protein n=1 Tax=Larkinella humicola TaxID=2607654 RepID=A0A5N1JBM8_9BACT|nr:DUF3667 domain-containing protein [Larkinella humicola]KAA9349815.1 DUF3667 domain-containing protein [Larkinella humicola]
MSLNAVKECPNCSANLNVSFNYCPRCGQTTSLHRFNLPHIIHEIFHVITHADKGVLLLLKELAIRPGMVAREYILEGKRKKYFNPFTFLVLVLGLTLFANSIFHPYTRTNNPVQVAATRHYKSEQQKQLALKLAERQQTIQLFLEKRSNLVAFLAVPVITLVYWLFFFRTGINYAEHLVAQVFFSGFYSLFWTLVLTPIRQMFPEGNWFSIAQLAFQLLYLTVAYRQFLPPDRPTSYLKSALAAVTGIVAWAFLSAGIFFLYVRFGG